MAKKNKSPINRGKVDINRDILLSIINLAAKEINGVEKLTNSYLPLVKRPFKSKTEGVAIKFEANGTIKVDIYMVVKNGYSVPDIAFRVQENVKNSLNSMVGLKPGKINVHVMDVAIDDDAGAM